jgi:hypothetical protein
LKEQDERYYNRIFEPVAEFIVLFVADGSVRA